MGEVVAIDRGQFQAFPKIPRMDGNMFVTEKIDGTNACVVVSQAELPQEWAVRSTCYYQGSGAEQGMYVQACWLYAQSRNRIITPENDNYGFAQFVWDNADVLAKGLGPGRHYGEWWGRGINRGYDMPERWFSLFNTGRWTNEAIEQGGMGDLPVAVVPLLVVHGSLDTTVVADAMDNLASGGSHAAPGYMNPEGVVVFHSKSGHMYKRTFDGDASKWVSEQAGVQAAERADEFLEATAA